MCEERENQQDATIRCLLSTSVSTCFGHHYARLQENKDRVTVYGVLRWFRWMWLVAVVGRCVVGCVHFVVASCWLSLSSHFAHDARSQEPKIIHMLIHHLLKFFFNVTWSSK